MRFVENQNVGIVQQRGCDQYALLHSLGVVPDREPASFLKVEKIQKLIGASGDQVGWKPAQAASQLQVFEAGKVTVQVGFFGYITQALTECDGVVEDVLPLIENVTRCRVQQAGQNLYRSRFAGAVRTQIARDLAGAHRETHVIDNRRTAKPLREVANFEHGSIQTQNVD